MIYVDDQPSSRQSQEYSEQQSQIISARLSTNRADGTTLSHQEQKTQKVKIDNQFYNVNDLILPQEVFDADEAKHAQGEDNKSLDLDHEILSN